VFTVMATWTRGRALLRADYQARAIPAEDFVKSISGAPPPRVKGAAVFMQASSGDVPVALLHNLKHNRILHEKVVRLTVVIERVPYTSLFERIQVASLGLGFWRVVGHYGYMQQPNVPDLLSLAAPLGAHAASRRDKLLPESRNDHRVRQTRNGAVARTTVRHHAAQRDAGVRLLWSATESSR
jgi:K+ transporter